MTAKEFSTTTKTRMLFALTSLGVATPAEAIGAVIVFYIVDTKNLPTAWYATFWIFYTIYNALNNPALGYMSDRTRSRWGRRRPYILFCGLPYVVAFALIFMAPFDGKYNPLGLLIFFGVAIVIWEGLYTAIATGYYGLLPEMFGTYQERTDASAKMNLFQILALILGGAVMPALGTLLGWPVIAIILGSISAIAIYIGYRALFEREDLKTDTSFPFMESLKATFFNRSYHAFFCHWHTANRNSLLLEIQPEGG
jgi:GPH family glycoside/pentoside/hexuronide:cation symporter